MSQITFYRSYEPVAEKVLQYYKNYAAMSTADRAEKLVENDQAMNKVFIEAAKDNMLGQHINILV